MPGFIGLRMRERRWVSGEVEGEGEGEVVDCKLQKSSAQAHKMHGMLTDELPVSK